MNQCYLQLLHINVTQAVIYINIYYIVKFVLTFLFTNTVYNMQSVTYLVSVYCLFCMCSKTCVKLEYMCKPLIAVITQNNINKKL